MSSRGKTLNCESRNIIYNVLQFALREKAARGPVIEFRKAMDRVSAMTGLSRDSLSKIKKEGMTNGGVWKTPTRKRGKHPKTISLNDFEKGIIRNKIQEFYSVRKEVPTLRKLLRVLKEDVNFTCSVESLRKILIRMGFKYDKSLSKKKGLNEHTDIVAWKEHGNITQSDKYYDNTKKPTSTTTLYNPHETNNMYRPQGQFGHSIEPNGNILCATLEDTQARYTRLEPSN